MVIASFSCPYCTGKAGYILDVAFTILNIFGASFALITLAMLRLWIASFAFSIRVFLRQRQGANSAGFILFFSALVNILIFGHEKTLLAHWEFIKAIWEMLYGAFSSPDINWEIVKTWLWQPSPGMSIYIALFGIFGLLHIIGIYFSSDTKSGSYSKGQSLLYLLFRNNVRLRKWYFTLLLEPSICFTIGFLSYRYYDRNIGNLFNSLCILPVFSRIFSHESIANLQTMTKMEVILYVALAIIVFPLFRLRISLGNIRRKTMKRLLSLKRRTNWLNP